MSRWRSLPALVCILFCMCWGIQARAQGTIYESPYVSFSPDGQAWTTNAGDRGVQWYPSGEEIFTGIASSLRGLNEGEHYYKSERKGVIPVGRWQVAHSPGKCIHPSAKGFNIWHGQSFGEEICRSRYYSGWLAYCADCNGSVPIFMYMSREAARSISYLPTDTEYFYLCPFCTHIEQGAPITHICSKISMNRYKVVYNKNSVGAKGYMQDDIFMYNNATEYEGQEVAPKRRLSPNSYFRTGYRFAGWNTEPDGSGISFSDEQEIYNLSDENWNRGDDSKGVVTLYACWELSESILCVDPNGGTYDGSTEPVLISQYYGTSFDLQSKKLSAPSGYLVSFETNGGDKLAAVRSTKEFTAWEKGYPFYGKISDSVYHFIAPPDHQDTVVCMYKDIPILLPTPQMEGKEFGGWYIDAELKIPVGMGGAEFLPSKDTMLYASWVDLSLTAVNNYVDNGGAGAVDLTWIQGGKEEKYYKLYQSVDRTEWNQIEENGGDSGNAENQIKFVYNENRQEYTVCTSGFYRLLAAGAQGGSCKQNAGGQGSLTEGIFWLSKGETLSISFGGRNGYADGGNSQSGQGNGGGSTSIKRNGETLIIAGGGGGAGPEEDGGAGGGSIGLREDGIGDGENGYTGGGAGYIGGKAGQIVYHTHSASCGIHEHTIDCMTRHIHTSACYQVWHINTSNEPRVDLPCGCRTQVHHFVCGKCGSTYRGQTLNGSYCSVGHYGNDVIYVGQFICCPTELKCKLTEDYYLICPYGEGYQCGMQQSVTVERIASSFGGSSFVSEKAISQNITVGGNKGDGYVLAELIDAGFTDENEKKGVPAKDLRAPESVDTDTVVIKGLTENSLSVSWNRVKDNGTVYYHKAESFRKGEDTVLCTSNITRNELCVGVKGYYVLQDSYAFTAVTSTNGSLVLEEQYSLPYSTDSHQTVFVHIAPVDFAGNIGETSHIKIDTEAANSRVYWGILTDQITINGGENVYLGNDGIWFVRADGETPVTLQGSCRLTGPADASYRPTIYGFLVGGDTEAYAYINTSDNGWPYPENLIAEKEWRTKTAGAFPLESYPYIKVMRSVTGERLAVERSFLVPESLHGQNVVLYPYGALSYEENLIESDEESDRKNGISLRGDGTGPVIEGTGLLEERGIESFLRGEYELEISASDSESGLKSLTATLYSDSNKLTETVTTGIDGKIHIKQGMLNEDLWNDTVTLTVEAADNVGNVTRQIFYLEDLWVTGHITRILPPHTAIFRSGESGILTINTGGNAERLEVIFPRALTELDSTLHSEILLPASEYSTETPRMFMIPLYATPSEEYFVRVIAYKGERTAETTVPFCVQSGGNILDEIRTRLR